MYASNSSCRSFTYCPPIPPLASPCRYTRAEATISQLFEAVLSVPVAKVCPGYWGQTQGLSVNNACCVCILLSSWLGESAEGAGTARAARTHSSLLVHPCLALGLGRAAHAVLCSMLHATRESRSRGVVLCFAYFALCALIAYSRSRSLLAFYCSLLLSMCLLFSFT
jgi:hypothetical protein